MRNWAYSLIFLVSFFLIHNTSASDNELKNLRWEWEVYDEDAGHFVPYIEQESANAIRFVVDLNKYRLSYLKLDLPSNCFVWIDRKLVYSNSVKTMLYWRLDSLNDEYKKNKIFVTLYRDGFSGHLPNSTVVNRNADDLNSNVNEVLKLRSDHGQLDKFIIVSIATLSLIALFRAFNFRLFREYLAFGKSIQLRQNFDLITAQAPLAWPNMAFILFYAFLVGNTIINIGFFTTGQDYGIAFGLSPSNNISAGFNFTTICFLLMLGKLTIITIGAELFKISRIRTVHFFTYFRLSLMMALIAFCLSIVNGIFDGIIIREYWVVVQILVVMAWIGRMVLVFFVLNKIYTFRKLHLFSYLCSSELIPLLLFFKVFLK